jgi:hypothetical protein
MAQLGGSLFAHPEDLGDANHSKELPPQPCSCIACHREKTCVGNLHNPAPYDVGIVSQRPLAHFVLRSQRCADAIPQGLEGLARPRSSRRVAELPDQQLGLLA